MQLERSILEIRIYWIMKKFRESNQELKKEVLEIVGIADSNDVPIACDDLFRAHRVILSTFSSFLENIL